MEERKDNNMEDFFRNSMEQFDDTPSDTVWSGIEDRLVKSDEKNRFIFKMWFFRGMFFLCLIGAAMTYFYFLEDVSQIDEFQKLSNEKVHDKRSKNQKREEDEKRLSFDETKSVELVSNKEKVEIDRSNKYLNTKHSVQDISQKRNNDVASINYNKVDKINIDEPVFNVSSESSASMISDSRSNKMNHTSRQEEVFNTNRTDAVYPQQEAILDTQYLKIKKLNSLANVGFMPLLSFSSTVKNINSNRLTFFSNTRSKRSHFGNYKLGISGRFFQTFVSDFDGVFNASESFGIRHELALSKKVWLTNAIYYNIQHYDVMPMNGPVNHDVLARYTAKDFQTEIVTIESKSEYFDFPLGLKWSFNKKDSGWSMFINPSINWQLYLPQNFKFIQADDVVIERNDQRMFAYLGSTAMRWGIEKKMSNSMFFQLDLWGEYSFIPIGIQEEKLKMLGISGSILFGK